MSVHLTENDYERSCTSSSLADVVESLRSAVNGQRPSRLLDVGCGYGGIAATLREELALAEAHGIDIDDKVLDEARGKGVDARLSDVSTERLPYDDGSFDLLTCFGMLDYLPWYDRQMDAVLGPFPSASRRFLYVGRRVTDPPPAENDGWWPA